MTPPPCKCTHLEQIIVWVRGHREPEKQRHDRCIHPTGPHPMHEYCAWREAPTGGIPPGAVDPAYHWRELDTCPKGVKVQLLTKWGCAVYGSWNGRDPAYTHWAPMPTRAPGEGK